MSTATDLRIVLGTFGTDPLTHTVYNDGRPTHCAAPDGYDIDLRTEARYYEAAQRDADGDETEHLYDLRFICRTCGHFTRYAELVNARSDSRGYGKTSGVPAHRRYPSLKAGPLSLVPDSEPWPGMDGPHSYLALYDATVVGMVTAYYGKRLGVHYQWSLLGTDRDALGDDRQPHNGEGCSTPQQAGKRLAAALDL